MKIKRVFFLIVLLMQIACNPPLKPLVIGHRGAAGHVAENTLPSITKAMELGVDGVEIDVFRCASGELVVFHDVMLDQLTNATGGIETLDLDSIQKIKVLGTYSIPTLKQVMDLIEGKILLNIELKGTQTAVLTHELLQPYFESGVWKKENILISSFNWKELELFYKVNQEVPIAILSDADPLDAIPIAKQLNAQAINPDFKALNKKNVQLIKKENLKIYPYTVNTPKDIQNMLALGVDGIITNYPERISQN